MTSPNEFIREEGVIYVDEWDGVVDIEPKTTEKQEISPIPYIIDFSPVGLMHIGWSD